MTLWIYDFLNLFLGHATNQDTSLPVSVLISEELIYKITPLLNHDALKKLHPYQNYDPRYVRLLW